MTNEIIQLSDDNFSKNVLQTTGLVLVDFWAEWCGPCKIIAPILTEVANEFIGKLTVAKLNIDKNSTTAPKYGVRSIPTLLLFRTGQVISSKVGILSKEQLIRFIKNNL